MDNQHNGSIVVFIALALYGAVYAAVESAPSLGFEVPISQIVGVWVILALTIASIFALRNLSLKGLFYFMTFLGVVGVILSIFLTFAHFGSAEAFCPAPVGGQPVACDVVNKSIWSEIMGIPVSALGILFYLGVAITSLLGLLEYNKLKSKKLHKRLKRHYLLILAIAGVIFTLWLNYIQFFELYTLCALCELSATTVVLFFISSVIAIRREK